MNEPLKLVEVEPEILIRRTLDLEVVQNVMTEMWDDISEDGVDSYLPDVVNEYYLLAIIDQKAIGMFRFHPIGLHNFQGHIFILPQYRDKYARMSGIAALKWIYSQEHMKKICAVVPMIYPKVIYFLKNMGFTEEGMVRSAYLKNGTMHHMNYLGMTRKEIGDKLWP